ncbi:zinc knuckle, partial [Ancylostoma duodenale]
MQAYMELKQLRRKGAVTEYCVKLEHLTRKAYPHLGEDELSITRAGELVSQLVEWPEYLQLYSVMEQSTPEAAYENVKSMAQCVERSRTAAQSMKRCQKQLHAFQKHDPKELPNQDSCGSPSATREKQDLIKPNPRLNGKCRKCHETGHFQRDCPLAKQSGRVNDERREDRKGRTPGPQIFTTTLDTWTCMTVKCAELAGEPTLHE